MFFFKQAKFPLYLFVAVLITYFSSNVLADQSRIVAAFGSAKVNGRPALVEVIVKVNPGQSVKETLKAALAEQGARPINHADLGSLGGFQITGLARWPGAIVIQNYNNVDEPSADVASLLQDTHDTWNSVTTSNFLFNSGEPTNRCPSLVRECPGTQTVDGYNDVGWGDLKGCCTLGVTWFVDGEADMMLDSVSNFFEWNNGTDTDIMTVLLHENGHVLGLGHSETVGSVMEAVYGGVRQSLHQDDIDGITYLYPETLGEVAGSVTDQDANFVDGGTVELQGTEPLLSASIVNGSYIIQDVPYPVTYTVRVSSQNCDSYTDWLTFDNSNPNNFSIDCSISTVSNSCSLEPVGASCLVDSDCCSNKCKGPVGRKSCK